MKELSLIISHPVRLIPQSRVYIAGPMRGYAEYNFPAFDKAASELERMGFVPVSPAALDREMDFDPGTDKVSNEFLRTAVARDIMELSQSDAIVLLPGWEESEGACIEAQIASMLDIRIFEYEQLSVGNR